MPLVAATGAVALAVEDGDADLLAEVHAALVAEAGLDELLGVLTSGGHSRVPGFACVAREAGRVRLLVRGAGGVTVHGGPDDGRDVTPAGGLATWREEVLDTADGLDLRLGDTTVLLWTPSVTTAAESAVEADDHATAAPAAADDHTTAAPAVAPDHTTVVGRTGGTGPSAPGAAPPPPQRTDPATRATADGQQPPAPPATPEQPADDATLAERPPVPSDDAPADRPGGVDPDRTDTTSADTDTDRTHNDRTHTEQGAPAPVTADGLIGGVPRRHRPATGAPAARPPDPTAADVEAGTDSSIEGPPPPAADERLGDHDGRTVVEVSLPADHTPGPQVAAAGGVPGLRCRAGHANPPHAATCRACGAPLDDATPERFERPTVARVVFTDGRVIELDRPHLLGRSPSPDPALGLGQPVGLHTIPDDDRNLSRNHVAVHVEGWSVAIEDLGSLNGTSVALPGKEPVRLRAGERAPLVLGARVELADVAAFELEAPR